MIRGKYLAEGADVARGPIVETAVRPFFTLAIQLSPPEWLII